DKLAVTGNLDLTALGNFLDVTGVGSGTSWVIATYTGTLTGTFESITSGYTVNYGTGTNSQMTLNFAGGGGRGYNGNGTVGAADDCVVWRKNKGITSGATASMGDGDGDGDVDDNDYNFWRARFGNTSGSGSSFGGAVPEPATIALIGLASAIMAYRLRRRR